MIFVALLAKFLVQMSILTEISPEWRLFAQCSKLRLLAVLELLLVRDPALRELSFLCRIFTQPDGHLEPSRHAAQPRVAAMAVLAAIDGAAFTATKQPASNSQPDNAANCSYFDSEPDIE